MSLAQRGAAPVAASGRLAARPRAPKALAARALPSRRLVPVAQAAAATEGEGAQLLAAAGRPLGCAGVLPPLPATRRRCRHVSPAPLASRAGGVKKPPNPITLSPAALDHLQKLRQESGGDGLLLRMGVKSGGCSGMSYGGQGGKLVR